MTKLLQTTIAGSLPKPAWLAEPKRSGPPGDSKATRITGAAKKTLGAEWRHYEQTFPLLAKSSIRQVSLECANSQVPIELIGLLEGKDVLVGAIDVATERVEAPEEVAATIRTALRRVPVERLYPCTNCGMVPLPRDVARCKLRALAAGAVLVRAEA